MSVEVPWPWPGNKARIASLVWERLGEDLPNYIEPCFGKGGVFFERPFLPPTAVEIVNDACGFVANAFRAIKRDPERVALLCEEPLFENELHAWHRHLRSLADGLAEKLEADIAYYDAEIAARWIWGQTAAIVGIWCIGPSQSRGIPQIGGKQTVGRGVRSPLMRDILPTIFGNLSARLRNAVVLCGDAERAVTDTATWKKCFNWTSVFIDPPYPDCDRSYSKNDLDVFYRMKAYAERLGSRPDMRIAFAYLEGTVGEWPDGWTVEEWRGHGGMGRRNKANSNRDRERIAFSPHCLKRRQTSLFAQPEPTAAE